jgi:hypothetical protein
MIVQWDAMTVIVRRCGQLFRLLVWGNCLGVPFFVFFTVPERLLSAVTGLLHAYRWWWVFFIDVIT